MDERKGAPRKRRFVRHDDDMGIDEVLCVAGEGLPQTYAESESRAILRIVLVERYKQSHLSGDEWRFSTRLDQRRPGGNWEPLSSGYSTIDYHLAALYAELYGDFASQKAESAWLFGQQVAAICFAWKGHPVKSMSYDGKPLPLLVAAGHAAWARHATADDGTADHLHRLTEELCAQPGCRSPIEVVYRMKKRFCQFCGNEKYADLNLNDHRGFCSKHSTRGDCGLEDSDMNYELVIGDVKPVDPDKRSPSAFGGFV